MATMASRIQRAAEQAASQLFSPAGQRTSGQELEESTEFESALTQNAPSGGAKETKTEHQDDSLDNDDAFDLTFDDKPVKPTPSAVKTALNVMERNLPFLNCRVEAGRRAHNETANQENAADPAKAVQRHNKLDKALDPQQNAGTGWENL